MCNAKIINFIKKSLKPNDIVNLNTNSIYNNNHYPVMKNKIINYINKKFEKDEEFSVLDCTYGTGGHSSSIWENFKNCNITALDLDKSMIDKGIKDERLNLVQMNFKNAINLKNRFNFILIDLGYSIEQLNSKRGFSYQLDEHLDMRFDSEQRSCSDLINTMPLLNLYEIFRIYSDIKNADILSKKIIEYRKNNIIKTRNDILKIINLIPDINQSNNNKLLKLIYQSLRILTNDEYNNLDLFLNNLNSIKSNNALVIFLSFHNMEHRLINKYISDNKKYWTSIKLNEKADKEEIEFNPASKSAKLYKFSYKDIRKMRKDIFK